MRRLVIPAVFAALGMVVPLFLSLAAIGIAWSIRHVGLAMTLYVAAFMIVGAIAS